MHQEVREQRVVSSSASSGRQDGLGAENFFEEISVHSASPKKDAPPYCFWAREKFVDGKSEFVGFKPPSEASLTSKSSSLDSLLHLQPGQVPDSAPDIIENPISSLPSDGR